MFPNLSMRYEMVDCILDSGHLFDGTHLPRTPHIPNWPENETGLPKVSVDNRAGEIIGIRRPQCKA